MPSSISSSRRSIGRWRLVLLVMVGLWLVFIEGFARFGFQSLSRVQRRTLSEYRAVVRPRPPEAVVPRVLFVGNSLLGAAVDVGVLQEALHPHWRVERFMVASTGFLDWYFGLKRLFREGAWPHRVVLMLNWRQLAASSVRGEYFAYYLMATRDFREVLAAVAMHPTPASSLLAGNLSAFYGSRVEIRKVVLGHLLPDLPDLTALMTQGPPASAPAEDLAQLAEQRLGALERLCAQHGARLIFVVAPTPGTTHTEVIEAAARRVGVVAIPPRAEGFDAADFSDGFHLSPAGAKKYSLRLADHLRETLGVTAIEPRAR